MEIEEKRDLLLWVVLENWAELGPGYLSPLYDDAAGGQWDDLARSFALARPGEWNEDHGKIYHLFKVQLQNASHPQIEEYFEQIMPGAVELDIEPY